jgi:membrane associated rhomboid family serine protease
MARFANQEGVYTNPVPRLTDPDAKAYVTTGLLAINVIVFLAMVFSGASPLGPKTNELARFGGSWGYALFAQHWRLLTATYVHAGIIHIGFNMWCLWDLGGLAERIFDRWVFFVVYTLCGLAGSVAAAWSNPSAVTVGASGAVFGLAGALISALYLGKLPVSSHAMQSTLKSLLLFAGYNLFFGAVVPYISNSAHIGGFLMGLGLGAVLAPSLTAPSSKRQLWSAVVLVAGGLLLLGEFHVVRELLLRSVGG